MSADETRELRDRLEATQTELKRAKDELVAAGAEVVALKERVAFLEWSLNGGLSKDLVLQLAEARAEVERLKQWVALEPQARPARRQRRVCLISVAGQATDEGTPPTEYVAFLVELDGTARDLIRAHTYDSARAVADTRARELGVEVEDFT